MSVLTPAETVIAARQLAAARPHLAAVAGIVRHEDLWQLCRDELTGVDVQAEGWDIRARWFGVVVAATPRLGKLRRGETIPWRVVAAQIARPLRILDRLTVRLQFWLQFILIRTGSPWFKRSTRIGSASPYTGRSPDVTPPGVAPTASSTGSMRAAA